MKNFVLVVLVMFAFMSCQQSQKIGYVDNTVLINDYIEKKDIETQLQSKIDAFQKRTDSMRQAFQLEINEAEIKARSMSQSKIQKLSKDLQDKETALSQRVQFEQQQIAQESQAKNDSLIKKVKNFVKDYGSKNGYSFILGSNEAGSVMYGKDDKDLTQTLLDLLNKQYSENK